MARRYFRRYRRGRRYSRKRYARKRYVRGVDRNSFCITQNQNLNFIFPNGSTKGYYNRYVNFGIDYAAERETPTQYLQVGVSILQSKKFRTLATLYDQIRLKGMSVKFNYVAGDGTGAQTVNMYTMVDRCATSSEMYTMASAEKEVLLEKFERSSSKRKTTLTGGRSFYMYLRPTNIQERQFINICDKNGEDFDYNSIHKHMLGGLKENSFTGFNPCIYTYLEKASAVEGSTSSIILNVEVKYYVEFRNSI